jgi:hypothetical protein
MKSSTGKIAVLIILSLTMGGLVTAQDTTEKDTVTISGSAILPGVVMEGLPGNPVTDASGFYTATVKRGWHGTVTPKKEGYHFMPSRKEYPPRLSDMTGENYDPKLVTFKISGRVGAEGVMMKGLPGIAVSGKDGKYRATVDYGWSGTVIPVKPGYTFDPPRLQYSAVAGDVPNQDFWPTRIGPAAMMSHSGGRKTLVVPAGEIKAEDLAEIIEDMQVMSHILDERFKQTRRVQGLFTDFGDFFGRDNRETEAIYLEGYGILFSMEVNFSFSPPTEPAQQEPQEATENVDPTWQQARQAVFQPGAPQMSAASGSTEEQGQRMVEELKQDLVATLKHVANIRVLQPDDWVILTVIGNARGFGGGMGMGMVGGMGGYGGTSFSTGGGGFSMGGGSGGFGGSSGGGYGGGMAVGGMSSMDGRMGGGGGFGGRGGSGFGGGMGMGGMMGGMGMGSIGTSSPTVLTIRAKKSDVDAFARGELDFDQFQKKVKKVMY